MEPRGFEPLTSAVRLQRSPNWLRPRASGGALYGWPVRRVKKQARDAPRQNGITTGKVRRKSGLPRCGAAFKHPRYPATRRSPSRLPMYSLLWLFDTLITLYVWF